MKEEDFGGFYDSIVAEAFDSGKMRILDKASDKYGFTSAQVKKLNGLLSFDKDKLEVMKKLYSVVVDKQNFNTAIDDLDFSFSKSEMKEFIRNYPDGKH